jgi:hypothetical protein
MAPFLIGDQLWQATASAARAYDPAVIAVDLEAGGIFPLLEKEGYIAPRL